MAENTIGKNLTENVGGLFTDTSLGNQPKGTQRYALNTVDETEVGDFGFKSNEEANEIFANISSNILLGKCYISNDELAVLSTNLEETESEIGILSLSEGTYTSHVKTDLGFKKTHQIDVIYRLRRGCERTIYFVDYLNNPFIYNFDTPDKFKIDGVFKKEKFKLFKSYSKVPQFRRVEVVEGGDLPPGSYVIAVQYLDEDLNPTEWITTSNRINIYNSKLNGNFNDIEGSTGLKNDIFNFPNTSKAISIDLFNLDENFKFYRIGIIKSIGGTGQVSKVTVSQNIPTSITQFIYGGQDFLETTIEEVQKDNYIIDKAKNISQVDNMLMLSNTAGKDINYCALQAFASKIKTELTTKRVTLNTLNVGNPKSPTVDLFSVGYMPGEIYSFAIRYLFADGSWSPGYHIPGNPRYDSDTSHRMNTSKNESSTVTYVKRSCDNYWGVDYAGRALEGLKVRHHRFPFRHEIGDPFVTTENLSQGLISFEKHLVISGDTSGIPSTETDLIFEIEYIIEAEYFTRTIVVPVTDIGNGEPIVIVATTEAYPVVNSVKLFNSEGDEVIGGYGLIVEVENVAVPVDKDLSKLYRADIFGIKFSNIDLPEISDNYKIIGYEIIRQERTEQNKTILDTGVLTPVVDAAYFSGSALIFPEGSPQKPIKLNKGFSGLITPEHKFNGKEYNNAKLLYVGDYAKAKTSYTDTMIQDVQAGTSYDPAANSGSEEDRDGFTLHYVNRLTEVEYQTKGLPVELPSDTIYYLDALNSIYEENNKEVFNVSSDNKTGIVRHDGEPDIDPNSLPYVIMYRDLANYYPNFVTDRFYKQSLNPTFFDTSGSNSVTLYGGDSYISPMKYNNTFFIDIKPRDRARKKSFWKKVLGGVLVAIGVVAAIFTAGASLSLVTAGVALAASTLAVQYGLSTIQSGLKIDKMTRAYEELWDKGLRDTVVDELVYRKFTGHNPPDDEVQWLSETVDTLWFESGVNFSLRLGLQGATVDYLKPKQHNESAINQYMTEKLTYLDLDRQEGRMYRGYAQAEFYAVNPDFYMLPQSKIVYLLPYEYECCTECREEFPHRVHYSLQSFSEELTDNFRVFLPNNYRDIPGETGPINNMFSMNNNLYLHTTEALWMVPRNYQERVTDQIVSFIGTGSYFEIPPQKMVDDSTGNSAGIQHKWGATKFTYGYFFMSSNQSKPFLFNGKNIEDLSLNGMSSFFRNNTKMINLGVEDNPSNPEGTGFISVYDSFKERLLITKVDRGSSWTLSYSLKKQEWRSFHSYIPSMYLSAPNQLYTWRNDIPSIWKHHVQNRYGIFYGKKYPFIIEYVSMSTPLISRVWDNITLYTQAKKLGPVEEEYVELEDVTFNKALFYNTTQCSGVLNLIVKDETVENYMMGEVSDTDGKSIIADRTEGNWNVNEIVDIRTDYRKPIFTAPTLYTDNQYSGDKVVNLTAIDYDKDWADLEPMRDKFLVIRLIFDTFDDVKLIMNYSLENETPSIR